jgi:hypothetical protein
MKYDQWLRKEGLLANFATQVNEPVPYNPQLAPMVVYKLIVRCWISNLDFGMQ